MSENVNPYQSISRFIDGRAVVISWFDPENWRAGVKSDRLVVWSHLIDDATGDVIESYRRIEKPNTETRS